MKYNNFKAKLLIVIFTACLFLLSCNKNQNEVSQHSSVSTNIITLDSPTVIPSSEYDLYMDYLMDVRPLIGIHDWNSPQDLSARDFLSWRYYRITHLEYESKEDYTISDKEGFYFPHEEFETYINNYFSIDGSNLRSEEYFYDKDNGMYSMGERGASCTVKPVIQKVEKQQDYVQIHYVTMPPDLVKVLTIDISGDNPKYLSCVTI